jgi:hypothetical protein
MAKDMSCPEVNFMIRPETRHRFYSIANSLPPTERIEFGIYSGDRILESFSLDNEMAQESSLDQARPLRSYGEIQGVVHAFFKETKSPKLVIRELASQSLVNCFFSKEMYHEAVALLQDRNAVVYVEGEISETPSGQITDIDVKNLTPAPEFDATEFEKMIGGFPGGLTGGVDAAVLLEELRE